MVFVEHQWVTPTTSIDGESSKTQEVLPHFHHPIHHMYRCYVGALEGVTPIRSLPPPGGLRIIWILGFASNRLTIADFRDVGILGV
jgi:hypothetical protein